MESVQEKVKWFKARYWRFFTPRSGLARERVKECLFRALKKNQSNISYLCTLRLLPCTKKSGLKSQNIKNILSKVNSKSSRSLELNVTLENELCDTSCVTTTNKACERVFFTNLVTNLFLGLYDDIQHDADIPWYD